jgi:hypothetical protein
MGEQKSSCSAAKSDTTVFQLSEREVRRTAEKKGDRPTEMHCYQLRTG